MKDKINKIVRGAIYVIVGGACGLLLNLAIMHSPLPEMFPAYTEGIEGRLFSVDIIFGIFLYCLAAPILEEFIFRIGVYGFLYRRLGFLISAVASSLLFGAYHMNMVQGIYAFIMGMLFCVLYRRDYHAYVPICLHVGANLAVWLLSNVALQLY